MHISFAELNLNFGNKSLLFTSISLNLCHKKRLLESANTPLITDV